MTASAAEAVRSVLRERAKLEKRQARVRAAIAAAERSLGPLRRELEQLQERVVEIDDALRGVVHVGKNGSAPAAATAQPSRSRNIDRLVAAIGRRGLDEWSKTDVAIEAGLPEGSSSVLIKQLRDAGKIRRTGHGRYRTVQGTIT